MPVAPKWTKQDDLARKIQRTYRGYRYCRGAGRCFVMGGRAPVAHGCHGKDASHMKRGNCTISLA